MRKVLIVAYYFPPIATSGSLRPLGFCRYLEDYGWSACILTTRPSSVYPPLEIDEELCACLPRGLHVERVPHANPILTLLRTRELIWNALGICRERPLDEAARNSTGFHGAGSGLAARLSAVKTLAIERLFLFPDPQRVWLRPAIRRGSYLMRRERPDIVLATGGPWTSLLVARALARRFGIPLVADFRDPWTRNPYPRSAMTAALMRKARQLERIVCHAAARIITNTPELRDQFVRDYPELEDRFVTITNGFDAEPFIRGEGSVTPRSGLEFWHFGTVYGKRDPAPLLRAVKALFDDGTIRPGQLRLRFVGSWDISEECCNVLAQELESLGLIHRERPIPHETCLWRMRSATALLLLQPASPLQIPGKIYEYLAAGRPLLIIGGEGATASLVERYRLGRCCPADTAAIKELLRQLVTGEVPLEPPRLTDAGRFHYRALTGELADLLNAVCETPSAARGRR